MAATIPARVAAPVTRADAIKTLERATVTAGINEGMDGRFGSRLPYPLSYTITFCSHAPMKRDPDLIRDLMIKLEAADGAEALIVPALPGYSQHQVDHHFRLLAEAGLTAAAYTSRDTRRWIGIRLTWAGHDYLDRIRDPAIWRHTKAAMTKAGSWSLETMGAIAKAAIMSKLEALGIGTTL